MLIQLKVQLFFFLQPEFMVSFWLKNNKKKKQQKQNKQKEQQQKQKQNNQKQWGWLT